MEPLVSLLQSQGFEVWWDRDLLVGGTYEKDIDDAIRSAECVLVIWSHHSVDSECVQAEAGDSEAVLCHELDYSGLVAWRREFPALDDIKG